MCKINSVMAVLAAAALVTSLYTTLSLEQAAAEEPKDSGISVAVKHKKKVSLLAVKNNGSEEIFGVRIDIENGKIKSVSARGWDRDRIEMNAVIVQTGDKSLLPGRSMIILLIVDNKDSPLGWAVFGKNNHTIASSGPEMDRKVISRKIGEMNMRGRAEAESGKYKSAYAVNNCPGCKIALVRPIFTDTAYTDAFYVFYELHQNDTATSEDLSYLTAVVKDTWLGIQWSSYKFFKPWLENNTINLITDIEVHLNRIQQYDKIILLHSEYVTQQYYDNLREWVSNGGTMILVDGNALYAEVEYGQTATKAMIRLSKGHGWEFNGTLAVQSVKERWLEENKEFIGSHFGGIGRYHEYNVIANDAATCLKEWDRTPEGRVCTYKFQYGNGTIYHAGIFGSLFIDELPELRQMLLEFLQLG